MAADDSERSMIEKLVDDLARERDELKLQLHLGAKELKEQWNRLEDQLHHLKTRLEPTRHAAEESAANVWGAMRLLAGEIKEGFDRIRKSIR